MNSDHDMKNLRAVLDRVSLPPMVPMTRRLPDDSLSDVAGEVRRSMDESPGLAASIKPGQRIAVAVGSRGMADLPILVREVVQWFLAKGASPFIVPAMGSHGNATAEGQTALLTGLGVTEESAGCPIVSRMDVVLLGRLPNGLNVYLDKAAHDEADGIFLINRVKGHTSFRGKWESGLVKMLVIGLGKQIGADSCHTYGMHTMPDNLPAMAAVTMEKAPVLGGLAVVENALDKVCLLEVVDREHLLERDAELLLYARERMPSLPCSQLDVLIVDKMGKDISGAGMDPNVLGRYTIPGMSGDLAITRIVALDLTEASHGNAVGMGLADFITSRLWKKVDYEACYLNALTSNSTRGVYTPLVLPTDRDAIRGAVKTSTVPDLNKLRMMRIEDTLKLSRFSVTACMVDEMQERGCIVAGPEKALEFTPEGRLV